MAHVQVIGIGILFLMISIIGFTLPISVTLADTTMYLTIPQVVAVCDSWVGQFAQMLAQVAMVCSEFNNLLMGVYGSGLLAIILIIVGVVIKSKKIWICEQCNYALNSEADLINHKIDKHPDKKIDS